MSFKSTMYGVGNSLQKNAPYIIFGVGVVSLGISIYTTIRASLKAADILDEYEEDLNDLEDSKKKEIESCTDDKFVSTIEASYNDDFKELKHDTVKNIAKLYIVPAAFTGLSVTSFAVSFGMLNKRYVGTLAAFTGVTEVLETYRNRVIEDQGEDKDYEYMYGVKKEKREFIEKDPETGKEKKVKKEVFTGEISGPFAYRFEKYDPSTETGFEQWDEMGIYSYPYISGILNQCQRKLDIGKKVWLHDVLRNDLRAGENVLKGPDIFAGWKPGDRISFGFDLDTEDMNNYLRGASPDVTLIFNCRPNLYAETYGKNLSVSLKNYIDNDISCVDAAYKEVSNE